MLNQKNFKKSCIARVVDMAFSMAISSGFAAMLLMTGASVLTNLPEKQQDSNFTLIYCVLPIAGGILGAIIYFAYAKISGRRTLGQLAIGCSIPAPLQGKKIFKKCLAVVFDAIIAFVLSVLIFLLTIGWPIGDPIAVLGCIIIAPGLFAFSWAFYDMISKFLFSASLGELIFQCAVKEREKTK